VSAKMARLRSSPRRRRERPPHRTARTVETANKADSTEPVRPKPAQRRAQQQTQPRLPFGGWAWGPPGSGSARQRIRRAKREKTYSVSRALGQHRCVRRIRDLRSPEGRVAVPARGENRAPPSGSASETNSVCQIKSKLLHLRRLVKNRQLCHPLRPAVVPR